MMTFATASCFIKRKHLKYCGKCVLFNLKCSFHSQDIELFVIFLVSLLLFPFKVKVEKWNKFEVRFSHKLADAIF